MNIFKSIRQYFERRRAVKYLERARKNGGVLIKISANTKQASESFHESGNQEGAKPPRIEECPRTQFQRLYCVACSIKYVCDDPERDDKPIIYNRALSDAEIKERYQRESLTDLQQVNVIGRQGGQRRNRVHVYRQPWGYPIRLCDHIAVSSEDIETIGQCKGIGGPAEKKNLFAALDWAETSKKTVICKHCRAVVMGKRGTFFDFLVEEHTEEITKGE